MSSTRESRHWTLEEMHALPEDGNKYELVYGELLVTPAPTDHHETIAARLTRILDPYVAANGLGYVYRPRAVFRIGREVEVEPDLMVRQPHTQPDGAWEKAPRPSLIIEILSRSESSSGGYKEVIALVNGKDVYSQLRFEGGVHRVQRVPATETQGRIHTSTATVAVMPEADDVDVQIDEKDLEISIAASGGPGGQGVNTTNSAVQIQHRPSGLIVKCQDERSQLKNKAKAMKVLRSRLLDLEIQKHEAAISAERKGMVGTGERSSKIRTYNYPQNRISDHRIKLTLNKLDRVIEGDLEELVTALRTYRQAALLNDVTGGTTGMPAFGGGDDE